MTKKNQTIRVTEKEKELINILRDFETSLLIRLAISENVKERVKFLNSDTMKRNVLDISTKYKEALESDISKLIKCNELLMCISD